MTKKRLKMTDLQRIRRAKEAKSSPEQRRRAAALARTSATKTQFTDPHTHSDQQHLELGE